MTELDNLKRIADLLREAREEYERDLAEWERDEAELAFRRFMESLQKVKA